jgi:hypothetical protein
MLQSPQRALIAELLARAGHSGAFTVAVVTGGGNNRVYRVTCEGKDLLLKEYFRHPDDPRDRLRAEFAFSCFAWTRGLRCLPEPIAAGDGLALFEFIHGQPLEPEDVGPGAVAQATAFFRQLNRHRTHPAAAALPAASEACFALDQHHRTVQRRLGRLMEIEPADPLDREARDFVVEQLAPTWERVRGAIRSSAVGSEWVWDKPLPQEERCLSPSDFGFHNAIDAGGELRFVDLEYAGWDDPAKTVCDFLCQPSRPVPPALTGAVVEGMLAELPGADRHRERARVLLPLYRVKWCCIMLNEFLSTGHRRRAFAGALPRAPERKRTQLEKARAALARVKG